MKLGLLILLLLMSIGTFAQEAQVNEEKSTAHIPPLFVVDGIMYLRADSTRALQHLAPDQIKSIQVVKGQEAIDQYGEEGKWGVIVITTKNASQKINSNKPLFLVDGKPIDDLGSVSPDDIASIEVIKDSVSLKPYGAAGAAGVIKITTKRKPRKK